VSRHTRSFAERFRHDIVPLYLKDIDREAGEDWSKLTVPELLKKLDYLVQRVLNEFGRESLKPTLLAGVAMENLQGTLTRRFTALVQAGGKLPGKPPAQGGALGREVVMGMEPGAATPLPRARRALA